ncbi:SdpI family protein [Agriterribacter sp.]|uniref:SdpI family protein n=1 Tax=Agriterribacter sp. TaxID=2821509 RepID=UPI002CB1EC45|nr:SdpI family protein [Agriterribacter sp.]HRO44464.1 SdpI family protein [Agriterribacter sp.]HRQ16510.1 SdpI family protein [Agriterribacter sp.]
MSPFTIITFVTGCTLIIVSVITLLHSPEKINTVYGYRTKASMRNQQTWEEANRYSSKLMLLCGGILTATGLLSFFLSFLSQTGIITGIVLTFLFSILPIPLTERHLKKLFDKEGNRKTE